MAEYNVDDDSDESRNYSRHIRARPEAPPERVEEWSYGDPRAPRPRSPPAPQFIPAAHYRRPSPIRHRSHYGREGLRVEEDEMPRTRPRMPAMGRRSGPYRPGEIPAFGVGPGIGIFEARRPYEGDHRPAVVITAVKQRKEPRVPGCFMPVKEPDDDGGHYNSRDPRIREAYPSKENAQNTTSNYYSGGLGETAWRKKKRQRAGLDRSPDPGPDGGPGPHQNVSIICFVTIGGKPEFAEPAAQFGRTFRTKECDDAYFAAFLMKEYGRIISQVRWYGRVMSFKTIAAVEFQTWRLYGSTWSLAEVDSIPETATRATMSHFSYQLRHPFRGGRHWVNKVEKLLKAADRVHANGRPDSGSKWNFRVHIIETIDVRAIYLAVGFAVLPSAAAGIVYGVLKDDFSTAFTVAGYVLASFSLIFAALATADFLGIETPDSFMASDVYKDLEIVQGYFPGDIKR